MSLATWKAEFYPIDAEDVPAEEAVAHSLQKWVGLRSANLEKHGVLHYLGKLYEGHYVFYIDEESCALCQHYWSANVCKRCPLNHVLGHDCVSGNPSPYDEFIDRDNPEPMITALTQCWKS